MNENGGSIPTGSEEWTLHSLPFILMIKFESSLKKNSVL